MIDFNVYQQQQSEKGYSIPYIIQLLYQETPKLDENLLLETLRKRCGSVEPIEEQSGIFGFAHTEKLMRVQEGLIPAQSLFTAPEYCEKPIDAFSASLTQTWDWQEAESVLSKVKSVVSISDAFIDGLTRKTRIKLIHDVVLSTMEVSQPIALHWLPSQRIVNPSRYVDDLSQGGQLFSSAVNVRMFKVENSDERVMDTMGLTGLGLPDLQCNFLELPPAKVGIYLYELAEYVFERGDIFRDGDTVDGLEPQQKWAIRKENAYVNPKRKVINVLPGKYAPPTNEQNPN
jgi:hypothetical protein